MHVLVFMGLIFLSGSAARIGVLVALTMHGAPPRILRQKARKGLEFTMREAKKLIEGRHKSWNANTKKRNWLTLVAPLYAGSVIIVVRTVTMRKRL